MKWKDVEEIYRRICQEGLKKTVKYLCQVSTRLSENSSPSDISRKRFQLSSLFVHRIL
jgi:hypothetical protein